MSQPAGWPEALLTVAFGALAGGLTNRVAIWMLFHPYEPPRLLGRPIAWLQGAVPKNQARLAGTIGRTVGTQLLTAADVAAELRDERLRTAFEAQLRRLIASLLEDEKPSLTHLLPEAALPEVRRILRAFLDEVQRRLLVTLDSEEFGAEATRILAALAGELEGESLADSLAPEQREKLRGSADAWLARLVDSEDFAHAVRAQLGRAAEELLRPGRSFQDLLPLGLVAAVEHAINDYLPIAMERLGHLLEDPKARRRVERAIHDLLERFMGDLRFHQRVVAKLIITEETVNRVVDTLEDEGADRLGDLLQEGEVQDVMARNVNAAIVEFLRRPTDQALGRPGDEQVESALDAITEWVVRAARDPELRGFLLDRAEDALLRAGRRSWADVVRLVPAERLGRWLASALRGEAGQSRSEAVKDWLGERLLSHPIGSLGRFGREGAAERLAAALAPPAWDWIAGRVPEVAANIRVSERVEEKIREFPLTELERLVRSVTERELNLIVRLGYLLGAIIGTALVGIRALLG
ncbi:MAG: DUF445 family protein [Gemmatimonadota bacterium]